MKKHEGRWRLWLDDGNGGSHDVSQCVGFSEGITCDGSGVSNDYIRKEERKKIYTHIYIYMHVYIYRERALSLSFSLSLSLYIYIYTCVCVCAYKICMQ